MSIKPFDKKIWLSSPTMHGEEIEYMREAYETNWMSTLGENINRVEELSAKLTGTEFAVALSSGTAALHLALKAAGVKRGDRVFCQDLTFAASANPIIYEGAEPIFIYSESDSWNMDPEALLLAAERYPDVKTAVVVNLYGAPAKWNEILKICSDKGITIIEDAAESLGASYNGKPTGSFGKYNIISFNGNKIITGSSGGALVTDCKEGAERARKQSTQSRETAPWYQHTEIGYNYRMSNVVAGVVRGQMKYLHQHIERKKAIYERYKEGLKSLPIQMNPFVDGAAPNYWLSCITVNPDAMCRQTRGDLSASYISERAKSCPTEILQRLDELNAEGRPIWKPMHLQPIFASCPFVTAREEKPVSEDIFERGICLPSDIKMTEAEQDIIIEVIKECFN